MAAATGPDNASAATGIARPWIDFLGDPRQPAEGCEPGKMAWWRRSGLDDLVPRNRGWASRRPESKIGRDVALVPDNATSITGLRGLAVFSARWQLVRVITLEGSEASAP